DNLAKVAICGCITQLGTKISSRLGSYVTAAVRPKVNDTCSRGALRMMRSGATFPFAFRGYTVADELPRFATHNSWCFVSTNTPVGLMSPVLSPLTTRAGATLPLWEVSPEKTR